MNRREFLGATGSLVSGWALGSSRQRDVLDDPTRASASRLSAAIHGRELRCEAVMRAYLARIHRYNPVYNAIVSMVDDDELVRQARRADRALDEGDDWGWLHGIPHAIKDLANAKGLETSSGSRIFAGTIASADDPFVARIRAAGAIFIGKTNTPEFGLGSQSYNDVHGTTRNAYDPSLTAGGSSGGAACGLATQMLPVADGSDMMGSLRNPAAFNNVIGFRPSQGRVPGRPGGDLYYHQLSTAGPMGRNLEDTIRLLGTMAGHDPRSPLSSRDALPPYESFHAAELDGCRMGWMADYSGYLATEPGVLDVCVGALDRIASLGADVSECSPAYDMARLWETWLTLRHWALSGLRELYDDPEKRELLKPEVVWEIEGSVDMPASRVSAAASARADWYRALSELFERYDVLVLPSAQVFPFSAELHWPTEIAGRKMDTYHRWMEVVIGCTLSGLPVVNLPAGFDERGRPMGMQFIGRMGEDQRLLEIAMGYEKSTDFLSRRPELVESFG